MWRRTTTSKQDSCQTSYIELAKLKLPVIQRVSGPGEYRGMKISLASYIVASMDNGNDPPAFGIFWWKQKITK